MKIRANDGCIRDLLAFFFFSTINEDLAVIFLREVFYIRHMSLCCCLSSVSLSYILSLSNLRWSM